MIEILPIDNNVGKHGLGNAEAFVRWRAEVLMGEGVTRAQLNAFGVDNKNIIDQYRQAHLQKDAMLEEDHDFLGGFNKDGLMVGAAETRLWTPKDEKAYRFPVLDIFVSRWIASLESDRPKPQPIGIFALLAEKSNAQTEVFENLLDHITKDQDKTDFLMPLTAHHPALPVATEYGFERTDRFARRYGAVHQLYIREGEEPTQTELAA